MLFRRIIISLSLITTIALSASCGKEESSGPAGPTWKPAGNEGNLAGTVTFTGAAPAPGKLDMANDPKCAGDNFTEDVLVNDGKLQNVFVYVKSGLPPVNFAPPTAEVTLDQKGCKYVPRVLGLQTGQPLKLTNSDATNHNIHPIPRKNREWNESQLAGQGPIIRKFREPEVLIPVKCNQHPWMLAHLGVLPHPFFAVSDAGGAFAIKGLPPGEYEIEAWHERYGAKTLKVTVPAKGEARADFAFAASAAYQPGSLKLQPAMMIP